MHQPLIRAFRCAPKGEPELTHKAKRSNMSPFNNQKAIIPAQISQNYSNSHQYGSNNQSPNQLQVNSGETSQAYSV